jgi:O-antigen/teichoic acid export membrane protein
MSTHGAAPSRGGAFAYTAGRLTAAGAQAALAVVVTRTVGPAELGQFTIGFVVAALLGILFASGIRRLTMHRSREEGLADILVAAVVAAGIGLGGASAVSLALFDGRTALIAATLTAWRAADTYAEIGQGVWAREERLASAGMALAVRSLSSLGVATAALLAGYGLLASLVAGLVVRIGCAIAETAASGARFSRTRERVAWTLVVAVSHAVVSATTVLVDTLPTVLLGAVAGLADVSVLTPLGRIRFAIVLAATTGIEIVYTRMFRARSDPRKLARVVRRPALALIGFVTVSAFPTAVVAPLVFGEILVGEERLVLLALASGLAMGLANLVSSAFTAQSRIAVQIVGYTLAVVVAVAIPALGGWSAEMVLVGQSCGALATLALLVGLSVRDAGRRDATEATRRQDQASLDREVPVLSGRAAFAEAERTGRA